MIQEDKVTVYNMLMKVLSHPGQDLHVFQFLFHEASLVLTNWRGVAGF